MTYLELAIEILQKFMDERKNQDVFCFNIWGIIMSVSSYLQSVFNPKELKLIVDKTVIRIEEVRKSIDIDVIAFTGCSGSAIAFPVSYITEIPLIYIRKEFERNNCHGKTIEHPPIKLGRINYLFLDDFIYHGNTFEYVFDTLNSFDDYNCVGVMTYHPTYKNNLKHDAIDITYRDKKIPIFEVFE